MVFMSVSMDRVCSLDLMLQIIGNIIDLQGFLVPANATDVLQVIFDIANFKIMENKEVQKWLKNHVFGHLTTL